MKLSLFEKLQLRLSSKKRLLVMGDSHTSVFKHETFKNIIKQQYQLFIETVGGATISGLDNPNSKTNAQALFSNAYSLVQPDILIMQIGEVDTGFVIWYRAQKYNASVDEMFESCIKNYCEFLRTYKGKEKTIVLSAPLPTIRDDQDWGEIANLRKEISVSQKQRTDLTLAFNRKMAENAESLGIVHINLDQDSVGDDGLVAPFLINNNPNDHHYARSPYINLIMKHLGSTLLEK